MERLDFRPLPQYRCLCTTLQAEERVEGAVVGDAAMNEGEVRASVERILADLFQRYRYKGQVYPIATTTTI